MAERQIDEIVWHAARLGSLNGLSGAEKTLFKSFCRARGVSVSEFLITHRAVPIDDIDAPLRVVSERARSAKPVEVRHGGAVPATEAGLLDDLDLWGDTQPEPEPDDEPGEPVCKACNGSGKDSRGRVCAACGGSGKAPLDDDEDPEETNDDEDDEE